jgi:hypothetical protein
MFFGSACHPITIVDPVIRVRFDSFESNKELTKTPATPQTKVRNSLLY